MLGYHARHDGRRDSWTVSSMRLGGEPVGWRGLTLLAAAGVVGVILAIHGWAGRGSAVVPVSVPSGPASAAGTAAGASPAPASPGSAASHSTPASPSASPSSSLGPLLSAEPYASYSYQVWPGAPSTAAKQALTGLAVTVHRQPAGLSVTAGVNGQASPAPHLYPAGARVYVVEASMGDDSGNSDFNLGDDGLVITDSAGRIVG
jgi:hypothetical protein